MTNPATDAKLSALYQEVILDHYRRPRNKGALEAPTSHASLRNPLCGDEVDVQVKMEDGRVADVKFGGQGCSISQASASMMTELTKGRTPEEVQALGERFAAMIRGDAAAVIALVVEPMAKRVWASTRSPAPTLRSPYPLPNTRESP